MLSQEQFDQIELEQGCGYWNLCSEKACPCAITTEHKGLKESIYNGFIKENEDLAKEYDDLLLDDYEPKEKCSKCGDWVPASAIDSAGLCAGCQNELLDELYDDCHEDDID